jgi:hypothetical protein
MRRSFSYVVIVIMLGLLAGRTAYADKVFVPLTEKQVRAVCGDAAVTNEGGCNHSCGNGQTCTYGCDAQGKCSGAVSASRSGNGKVSGPSTVDVIMGPIRGKKVTTPSNTPPLSAGTSKGSAPSALNNRSLLGGSGAGSPEMTTSSKAIHAPSTQVK